MTHREGAASDNILGSKNTQKDCNAGQENVYKSPLLHRVRPNIRKPVRRVPSESEKEVPTIPLLASNRTICKAARRIDHTAWSLEGHQPSCKQGPCCDPTNIQQSWSADKQNQSEGHNNM